MFRKKQADVLICTDAAAEGLNFQFCGALINYDMPWNPMRVEQRIGRIDRLGQAYGRIRIVNLHYKDTVEADVYEALRSRIKLFEAYVGGLQPILSRLPKALQTVSLSDAESRDREKAALVDGLSQEADAADTMPFNLDEITEGNVDEKPRPESPYDLRDVAAVLRNAALLQPGDEAVPLRDKEFQYQRPGMDTAIRVTTDPGFYEEHADSVELWSPGSPMFPRFEEIGTDETADVEQFTRILST